MNKERLPLTIITEKLVLSPVEMLLIYFKVFFDSVQTNAKCDKTYYLPFDLKCCLADKWTLIVIIMEKCKSNI